MCIGATHETVVLISVTVISLSKALDGNLPISRRPVLCPKPPFRNKGLSLII